MDKIFCSNFFQFCTFSIHKTFRTVKFRSADPFFNCENMAISVSESVDQKSDNKHTHHFLAQFSENLEKSILPKFFTTSQNFCQLFHQIWGKNIETSKQTIFDYTAITNPHVSTAISQNFALCVCVKNLMFFIVAICSNKRVQNELLWWEMV